MGAWERVGWGRRRQGGGRGGWGRRRLGIGEGGGWNGCGEEGGSRRRDSRSRRCDSGGECGIKEREGTAVLTAIGGLLQMRVLSLLCVWACSC